MFPALAQNRRFPGEPASRLRSATGQGVVVVRQGDKRVRPDARQVIMVVPIFIKIC
jgi:hypothetical protein